MCTALQLHSGSAFSFIGVSAAPAWGPSLGPSQSRGFAHDHGGPSVLIGDRDRYHYATVSRLAG